MTGCRSCSGRSAPCWGRRTSTCRSSSSMRRRATGRRPLADPVTPGCGRCATSGPKRWRGRATTACARRRPPWVAFVDDDDLWAPRKLRDQLGAIGRDGDALWSCVGSVVVDPDLRIVRHSPVPRDATWPITSSATTTSPAAAAASSSIALVLDVGGFDPGLSTLADWDLGSGSGCGRLWPRSAPPRLAYVEHGGMSRSARNIEHELETMAERYADERQGPRPVVRVGLVAPLARRARRAGRPERFGHPAPPPCGQGR